MGRQKWGIPEYSKTQVDKAGKSLSKTSKQDKILDDAISIINNWRAAHAYPLHVVYVHLRKMAGRSSKKPVVAERLKRLDSIVNKLMRHEGMMLSRMQDIGGCRVILPSIDNVNTFTQQFMKSRIRHKLIKKDDYIAEPKESGYRGVHLIYKYHSNSDSKKMYNEKMFVEIQFRTKLQHLWATAVETMGLFSKQALKSGEGDDKVKYFFALVSSLFAIIENSPIVPNTFDNREDIISAIRAANDEGHYLGFLSGIRVVVSHESKKLKKDGYYLLILDYRERKLKILFYDKSRIEDANKKYNSIEKNEKYIDAVLVGVDSFKELCAAYPNYFSDIGEFISVVQREFDNVVS
jgi:hypothetical protein